MQARLGLDHGAEPTNRDAQKGAEGGLLRVAASCAFQHSSAWGHAENSAARSSASLCTIMRKYQARLPFPDLASSNERFAGHHLKMQGKVAFLILGIAGPRLTGKHWRMSHRAYAVLCHSMSLTTRTADRSGQLLTRCWRAEAS